MSMPSTGNELYIKRVYRDDDFIEKMESELWEHAARVKSIEKMFRAPFNKAANDAVATLAVAA